MKTPILILIIALTLSGCASNPAWEKEQDAYVMYATNPSYRCGKEFGMAGLSSRVIRGCHMSLGDTHFIIVPEKTARDYQCIRDHEMLHVQGWEHDESYVENCR